MRVRFAGVLFAAVAALTAVAVRAQDAPPADASDVVVSIETNQRIYYAGDPIDVRLTIFNRSDESIDGPGKRGLASGIELRRAGEALEPAAAGVPAGMEPPKKLAGGHFFGVVADLRAMFPALGEPGTYQVSWQSEGEMRSGRVGFRVIERFELDKEYEAVIHLPGGEVVLELMADSAPKTAKMFVDLARQGYYDGVLFTRVLQDKAVYAGRSPGAGGEPVQYAQAPRESTRTRHLAGSVAMYRAVARPGDVGAEFYIALGPLPEQDGRATVFAQVVEGMEIVRGVAGALQSGVASRDNMTIESIEIRERTED